LTGCRWLASVGGLSDADVAAKTWPSRALRFDRDHPGSLYARARIADYWIVNIPDRRLEVHREPVPDTAAPFAWRYGRVVTLGPDGRIAPLAAPPAPVTVADLLP
jgi:hypothetical protein